MNSYSEKNTPILNKIILVSLFTCAAFSMFSISITQVAAGVGGMAWLFQTHINRVWQEQQWPLGIPFVLFIIACLIAVIDAFDPSYSYTELRKLLEMLIFFWVINCTKSNQIRKSLIMVIIISATIASLYGFYQGSVDGVTIDNRVEGTMSVYMTFAGLIMLAGVFSLGRALFRQPREIWLLPVIGIFLVCLLFTFTRQAWFGFLMGFLFLVFVWKRKITSIASGLFLIILLTYGSNIQSQALNMTSDYRGHFSFIKHLKFRVNSMLSGKDRTFFTRVSLWKGGWEIFKDNPLTGCGFKCVDLIHTKYPDPTGHMKNLRGMHNNIIQLAVDTGVIGVIAWSGIWFSFFRLLYLRNKFLEDNSENRWIIYGSAASGVAFLAGGLFETNFYDSEVVMLLYFIMALPFAHLKHNKVKKPR
jgi:putative inorganic carbon (hco3(-)) transporter